MEIKVSVIKFRSAVNLLKSCNADFTKCESLKAKIAALQEEYNASMENVEDTLGSFERRNGVSVLNLVKKIYVTTGTDANGKETRAAKYVAADGVRYDEDKKEYIVTVPDAEPEAEAPAAEEEVPAEETTAPVTANDDWM